MRHGSAYAGGGLLLVLLGLVLLLQNFGLLGFADGLIWGLFWAAAFAAGGLVFLTVYSRNRLHWWALIPGCTLLGLGAMIGLSLILPSLGALAGSIFFLAIALAFLLIYLTTPDNWWAVIPGGVLLTLAVVAAVGERIDGTLTGAIFFLGLALTFTAVYFMPTSQGRMRWAAWPAGACGLLGLLVLAAAPSIIGWVWPLILIGLGAYLVIRVFIVRPS